jgi:hypothetical protein
MSSGLQVARRLLQGVCFAGRRMHALMFSCYMLQFGTLFGLPAACCNTACRMLAEGVLRVLCILFGVHIACLLLRPSGLACCMLPVAVLHAACCMLHVVSVACCMLPGARLTVLLRVWCTLRGACCKLRAGSCILSYSVARVCLLRVACRMPRGATLRAAGCTTSICAALLFCFLVCTLRLVAAFPLDGLGILHAPGSAQQSRRNAAWPLAFYVLHAACCTPSVASSTMPSHVRRITLRAGRMLHILRLHASRGGLHVARLARCLVSLQVAIVAARCATPVVAMHVARCISDAPRRTVWLARAAAAAPIVGGALAHARRLSQIGGASPPHPHTADPRAGRLRRPKYQRRARVNAAPCSTRAR